MFTLRHNVIRIAAARILALLAIVVPLMDARQASAANPSPGSAPVNIVAPLPLPVKDVNSPARQPFQTTLCKFIGEGTSLCQSTPSSYLVPGDRRLVIEYVSGLCPPAGTSLSNPGENISGAILTTVVGGVQANHLLRITPGVAVGATQTVKDLDLNGFVVAQLTRIYADPGSQVTLDIDVGGLGNNDISCTLAISGFTETP